MSLVTIDEGGIEKLKQGYQVSTCYVLPLSLKQMLTNAPDIN
jgi:hypothetical protein